MLASPGSLMLHSVSPGWTSSSPVCCSVHQEPHDEDAERGCWHYPAPIRDEDEHGKER